MTNEIEDLKRDSARLTWLIDEALEGRQHLDASVQRKYARQYIDLMMAADDEAEATAERARWCEEMKAKVEWEGHIQQWAVYFAVGDVWRYHHDPDRNTAIDKARGVK